MKKSKEVSIWWGWFVVLLLATIWVGFAIGSIFITGAYIWFIVLLSAGIVGGGILYFVIAAEAAKAPERGEGAESSAQQQRVESTLAEHAQQLEKVEGMAQSSHQAVEKFGAAIAQYAEQLNVHTAVVRDLSEAAQELKAAAQEQNRVLSLLKGAVTEQPTEPRGEEKPAAGGYVTKAEYAEQLRIHNAAITNLSEVSQGLSEAVAQQSKVLCALQESIAEQTKSQTELKAVLCSLSGYGLGSAGSPPSPNWEQKEGAPRIPWGWQLGGAGLEPGEHWEQKEGKPRIPWGWELGQFA